MSVRTELCQFMVIDPCTQSTFHTDGFWRGKFREQWHVVFMAQINSWKEMTRTPYEQYAFRQDTRDMRHVRNVSGECIFLFLII